MSTGRNYISKRVVKGLIAAIALVGSTSVVAQTAGNPVPLRPSVPSVGGTGIVPRMPGSTLSFDPKKLGSSESSKASSASGGDGGTGIPGTVTPPGAEEIVFKANYDENNDAKCIKLPLNAKINIDFQDAPLDDLIKFIGCITEKNFMLKSGVGKGKNITIMSPTKVTVYEAYRAFLAALEVNGLTVVPTGKFLKIEEIAKAKQDTIPIFLSGESFPKEERFVTRLVQLEHIAADEIQATLQKFKTQQGDISTYAPTNTLIITDTGANIVRILRLLKELDVPTGKERIWIRPVEYAEATELVDKLQQVFGADKSKSSSSRPTSKRNKKERGSSASSASSSRSSDDGAVTVSKILADERTNQLIIMANRSSYFKLDRLIRKLDVPIPGEGQIHIHYLENADAEEISNTLSNLTQSGGASRRKTSSSKRAGSSGSKNGSSGGAAALFEGDVKISPHEETNSLVIEASLKDYRNLKQVIQKLDIRRKQVYVEAVIMEITSTKGSNLGVSGSAGAVFSAGGEDVPLLVGAGGLGISGFDPEQLNSGGLAVGLQGPLVDVQPGSAASLGAGALSVPTFGFLVQALQSNSDVNILSTPHILTTDNEEAEIQVGKQIPYRSSGMGGGLSSLASLGGLAGGLGGGSGGLGGLSSLGGLGGLGGFGTTQYIDVDLTLKITPHVNESNFVRLEIEQELEDVEALDENLGPTTSRRRVNNTVVVRDGQPVVIGGLIRDSESEGVSKIPFLGDIPVIGYFFRSTVKSTEKKNLLMVIIPTVIADPSDLKRLHEQRVEEMREFADQMATKKKEYLGEVDYRKKSGVLEEMYKVVSVARDERELLENTTFDRNGLDMVGPPETHEIEYDPYKAGRMDSTEEEPFVPEPSYPAEKMEEPMSAPAPAAIPEEASEATEESSAPEGTEPETSTPQGDESSELGAEE